MEHTNITIIGAGNVGFHLAKVLSQNNFKINQVFSRDLSKANSIAAFTGAEAVCHLEKIDNKASIYMLAVSDDAIKRVAEKMMVPKDKLVVHTSGATSSSILDTTYKRNGVFYPLQSFSIEKEMNWERIPICVFAKNSKDLALLEEIGNKISKKVLEIDDKERAILHVTAVMVNNFSNHLFHLSHQILKDADIPFEMLIPLIEETVEKIKGRNPAEMQTGPARRGDKETIKRHLDFLEKYPNTRDLYNDLSQSILKLFFNENNRLH